MGRRSLNGAEWAAMIMAGALHLSRHVERINALNVFPVPDGDTGTNMNMTMKAGVAELERRPSDEAGKAAEVLARGLLMGARGNSGVILSQLFRGFVKAAAGLREIRVAEFAAALQHGVEIAYKAVVKPVEGTILTVAREAAREGALMARRTDDLYVWMREVRRKAEETLARTPDMLPVLNQVGVVDAGGQGLVFLYEGFLEYLQSEDSAADVTWAEARAAFVRQAQPPVSSGREETAFPHAPVQAQIATESIVFPYDMEFFIRRTSFSAPFSEAEFRRALERDGDSVIIIDDGDTIKVHVHSRKPGDVLNLALTYGELTDIHILNMRQQHRGLLDGQETGSAIGSAAREAGARQPVGVGSGAGSWSAVDAGAGDPPLGWEAATGISSPDSPWPAPIVSPARVPHPHAHEMAPYGIVAVSVGEGNAELFRSLGVDVVLAGGQTMNPSTEDVLQAIEALAAEHVMVLPNNPNIILAAEQAANLAGKPATVIPTRSILQGMAAMLAFLEDEPADVNARRMAEAAEKVIDGQVTKAVRDTKIDGLDIREGQYIGIMGKTIVTAGDQLLDTVCGLLERMMENGGDVVTVLTGEGADGEITRRFADWLAERYPDAELEIRDGGQPLYPYLLAVEQ